MNLFDTPLLKTIIESSPVGICIINADDFFVEMVNDRYVKIFGKSKEALLGKTIFDSITNNDKDLQT